MWWKLLNNEVDKKDLGLTNNNFFELYDIYFEEMAYIVAL